MCKEWRAVVYLSAFSCVSCMAKGRGSVGGQKKRWSDMMMEDLKRCDLLQDWKETAKDRGAWRCFVMEVLSNVNECMETQEKERKDVMEKRREETVQSESPALKCKMTGCGFIGLSKAGIVNDVQQRHGWKTGQIEGEVSLL